MAKETKKPASEVVTVTEENVLDQIKNGNLLKETNVKAALEEIEKQKDEKQKKEAMNMICVAKYQNSKALLELRARRREEKNTKEFLTETKNILDEVLGGKITPTDYNKKRDDLREEFRKKNRESDKQLSEEMQELRESFEGRWQYWWD
jgi:hypothetical protein|uniref:Uncharacterized protein n=1 Tax=Podoviridae sp. ctZkC8 TaxID=2825259 RepID=A0A8S5UBQ6_9CAUD|nr:MAG TPA: hypothetical protein [Podoviridae sp. ctZkC8]